MAADNLAMHILPRIMAADNLAMHNLPRISWPQKQKI